MRSYYPRDIQIILIVLMCTRFKIENKTDVSQVGRVSIYIHVHRSVLLLSKKWEEWFKLNNQRHWQKISRLVFFPRGTKWYSWYSQSKFEKNANETNTNAKSFSFKNSDQSYIYAENATIAVEIRKGFIEENWTKKKI